MELAADCARCAALCCVALAFDRSAMFAIDKPAGEACPHLDACGGCTIHETRAARGFRGCIGFDCLGAGQRVTQEIFQGRSWREDPSLLAPMSRAFSALLRLHDYLLLLKQAENLDLSPSDRWRLTQLRQTVEAAEASEEQANRLKPQIYGFLASLRAYVEGREAELLPG